MSFTRFRYDDAREEKRLQESTDPGRWVVNVPGNGPTPETPDFMEDPHIRLTHWAGNLASNPLAVEDDLRGMTRRLNRDEPEYTYKSHATARTRAPTAAANRTLTTDQSRATDPAWMVRDIDTTRWEILMKDPQAHTQIPFSHNVGSRMGEKDMYSTQNRSGG